MRTKQSEGKAGVEQYRALAYFCDPAAGGRNLNEASTLSHPQLAPSIQALPSRIAEWKNLEIRVKARSGETMPTTPRNLALINLCPHELQKKLYDNTAVATGTMPFDELENLIMTNVHQKWTDRRVGGT